MVTTRKGIARGPVAVLACLSLAACLGSNGGGGGGAKAGGGGNGGTGGGSAPSSAFEDAFSDIQRTLPTQTEITGEAQYGGQVSVRTNANPADAEEAIFGDLALSIDFDDGDSPISASVDNLSGPINGAATDIAGTLSTDNANNQVNAITATQVNIPGQGTSTITGMSVGLEGTLSDPTGTLSGEALMTLQGNFVGDDGAGVFGANAVAIRPDQGADFITGGTWYADK